jgi:hypothetical protein
VEEGTEELRSLAARRSAPAIALVALAAAAIGFGVGQAASDSGSVVVSVPQSTVIQTVPAATSTSGVTTTTAVPPRTQRPPGSHAGR